MLAAFGVGLWLRADVGCFESVPAPDWWHIDEKVAMQTRPVILEGIKSGERSRESSTLPDLEACRKSVTARVFSLKGDRSWDCASRRGAHETGVTLQVRVTVPLQVVELIAGLNSALLPALTVTEFGEPRSRTDAKAR